MYQSVKTIKKFKAISQTLRLRALHLIVKAPASLCICELMDALQKEQYQISRCLAILEKAALIQEQRQGRLLFYSPVYDIPLNRLLFSVIDLAETDLAAFFTQDLLRLRQRLDLRKNGKVMVTYCNS
jgi:DNA-binding transcriptional ArsR family regulator